jgi:hypothetical protein
MARMDGATRLEPFAPEQLSAEQLERVAAIADLILPRTDTPSASDVDVPAFVNAIVSQYLDVAERAAFLAGIDAIDPSPAGIKAIEASGDGRAEPARTYWRLKLFVLHGYFTSERVMKEVLRVEIMPGQFEGAAPMPLRPASQNQPRGGNA